jgi:hypothetical protein
LHREEVGGVILFWGAKCVSAIAAHRQLMEVCDDVMTIQNVRKWCMEFEETYIGMMVTMIAAAPVGCARRMSGGTEFGKQASRLVGHRFRDSKEALMAVRGWLRTRQPISCQVGTCVSVLWDCVERIMIPHCN